LDIRLGGLQDHPVEEKKNMCLCWESKNIKRTSEMRVSDFKGSSRVVRL
jgi:hypothetical protein